MNRILPLLLLSLAGCADTQPYSSQWSRSATSGQTQQADLDDCRGEAMEGTARARRIDDDTTRQRDQTRDAYAGTLVGNLRRYDTDRTFYESIDRCMRGRGYAPVSFTR